MSVIVIEFITLDGIVSDPDGSDGTATGGWAFRHGRETVTQNPFRLGNELDDGVLLLGRKTWQLFSRIWPGRDDPFSAPPGRWPTRRRGRTRASSTATSRTSSSARNAMWSSWPA